MQMSRTVPYDYLPFYYMGIRTIVFLCLTGLLTACASSTTVTRDASKAAGNNNVVTRKQQNSHYSSNKTDGTGTIIMKGSNNLVTIDITDSDIQHYNSKTITIIEGDNNNLTSARRKCVLVYKDRTDTIIVKGNQLKIDFTDDDINALLTGGGKFLITNSLEAAHFNWRPADDFDKLTGTEKMYVEPLGKTLPLLAAFDYYTEQAQQGDDNACYQLGRLYDDLDFDMLTDRARAAQYYERAARHNHALAAFRLGQLYELGDFEFGKVAIDRAKAEYYYRLAAQNGSVPAEEKLASWSK